jgi:hypothetical protein
MGGMNWLSQLASAHQPPPASWWPPAPGWWALFAMFVLLVAAIFFWYRNPRQRIKRAALSELKALQEGTLDDAAFAAAVEDLLRRYALVRYGRQSVAGLSGERWISFLSVSNDAGESLLRIAYGGKAHADRSAWLAGARAFIGRR